jgi:capsular polysaccharide export protein
MLDQVMQSFARHAPENGRLIIKQHPLDNDLENWRKVVAEHAAKYRIENRVAFIEKGNLAEILRECHGSIVVNSTTGLHSLRADVPTIVLGAAVFDIPGLTHQGGLDVFWRHPERIDRSLLACFIKALAGAIQIKGNFYHSEGRKLGISTIVDRVIGQLVNEPDAYVAQPPRLAWKRLPLTNERKGVAAVLPGAMDLAGSDILGGAEPAFATVRAVDAGDRRGDAY